MKKGKGKARRKTALGTLTLTRDDRAGTATIHAGRTWGFAGDAYLARDLRNATILIDLGDHGPADGPFGPRQLEQLADLVGGTIELVDLPVEPPGTVY